MSINWLKRGIKKHVWQEILLVRKKSSISHTLLFFDLGF
jgi:hypothetical protein